MKKALTEGLVLVMLFVGIWMTMSRVDWVKILKIDVVTDRTEEKLGNLFWKTLKNSGKENTDADLTKAVDSILSRICEKNAIPKEDLKLHILKKDEVNAFALPDGHLVIYTGLFDNADKPEELAGVISHELAHIQNDHVMKKLIKEVGLSALISITTGNSGGRIIRQTAETLSSTAFDRRLEKEADLKAVDYMVNAGIDPQPFSDFLNKLAREHDEDLQNLSWLSTHPNSKDRARYVSEYGNSKQRKYTELLDKKTWADLKEKFN